MSECNFFRFLVDSLVFLFRAVIFIFICVCGRFYSTYPILWYCDVMYTYLPKMGLNNGLRFKAHWTVCVSRSEQQHLHVIRCVLYSYMNYYWCVNQSHRWISKHTAVVVSVCVSVRIKIEFIYLIITLFRFFPSSRALIMSLGIFFRKSSYFICGDIVLCFELTFRIFYENLTQTTRIPKQFR